MTFLQAIIMGLLQGISELFPISSLGHSVVLPQLVGWHSIVQAQAAKQSFFLSFLVGLHVATAAALFLFFWRDWVRIISALIRSIATRRIDNPDAKFGWLLVVATIPAGLMGLAFEHLFRSLFAKPLAASIFLFINGIILVVGERERQKSIERAYKAEINRTSSVMDEPNRTITRLNFKEAGIIGVAQVFALLAGISRSGITMVAGLVRGLSHEDAARFSFMLATPIIAAAGLYKIPDIFSSAGVGVRPQILVGSIFAFIAAYVSVRFLVKYFKTNNLYPFAAYCLAVGSLLIVRFI
ncbi:MAG: undecaprenyl-diphosphate phosphatase [Acidimicrobiaceae bacterium]|nr:undecaprenyl-diphosphate phosphatase [Acidimicrobiaceae bacterium]